MDLATLGLAVDSSPVAKAVTDLDRLTSAAGKAEKANDGLSTATGRSRDQFGRFTKAANDNATAAGRMAREYDRVNKSMVAMQRYAVQVGAALAAAFSIRAFVGVADQFTKFNNSLRVAGVSAKDMAVVQDRLFAAANRNGVAIGALGELYSKAAMSAGELGVTQSELLRFVDGVSAALKVQGGSVEAASGALLQLGQALGAGTVRAEEFNSILEGAYPIAQAAARGMDGMGGSVARLRQAVVDGKVSSEAFFRALLKGFTTTEAIAAGMSLTVESSLTVLQNSFTRLVGTIDTQFGVSSGIASAIQSLGLLLDRLADKVDGFSSFVRRHMREIAAATVLVGTAITVAFGPAIIGAAIAGIASLSSAVIAAVTAMTVALAANPIGAIVVAISAAITAAYVFRDEIKNVFGVDVVETIVSAADLIINSFEAAYEDIKFVWNNFPTLMKALAQATANGFIKGIEWMVNTTIRKINQLLGMIDTVNKKIIDGVNAMFGSDLNYKSIAPQIDEVSFGRYASSIKKATDALAEHGQKQQMIMQQSRIGELADQFSQAGGEVRNLDDALAKLPPNISQSADEAKKLADQLKDLRSRADGLLEKFFPGEAARREAEELSSLLAKFGDQLDALQRKSVEIEIGNLFKASELGLRNLDQKTKQAGKSMADSLQETLGAALADLWSGPTRGLDDFVDKVIDAFAQLGRANLQAAFDNLFSARPTVDRGRSASASQPNILSGIGDWLGGIFTDRQTISAQDKAIRVASSKIPAKPLVSAMSGIGDAVAKTTSTVSSSMTAYMNAIKQVESGGNYNAVGPLVKKGMYAGQRALGAYQVMPGNIPSWTKELLGYSVSAQDFLRNRAIQDGVIQQQLQKSLNKFGNFSDAASVWFTGRPLNKARGASDGYNSVEAYVRKANTALGQTPAAVASGSEAGVKEGIKAIANMGPNATAGAGAGASASAAGSTAMGGLSGGLSAALGGFGMGVQSENPAMGALGGAISGFSAGGLPGAVIGGIAGFIGGIFGKSRAKKKEQAQARNELNSNKTAIAALFATGEGRGIGSATQAYNEFYDKTAEIDLVAQKAGDDDLVKKLRENVNKFFVVLERDFIGKLPGVMEAYSSGLGSNSPFIKGATAMQELREELKDFIADAQTFGDLQLFHNRDLTPEQLAQRVADAQDAAQKMALAAITGVEPLSAMEQEMMSLKGATSVLQVTLEQLGMGAEEAAKAIDGALQTAVFKLRDGFMKDITASINQLEGVGYINEILDAQEAYQQRLKDSAALGIDGSYALRELSLSLKDIVVSSGLTKEEIDILSKAFPQLQFALKGWSQDTLTLSEATSQLQAAYDKEAAALDDVISRTKSFIASIKQFREAMKISDSSPLGPLEKVNEAAKQFRDLADKAMAGDEEAMGQLTQISQDYLDEARAYYTSSVKYFEIWNEVDKTLEKVQNASEGNLSEAEKQLKALDASVAGILKIDESVLSVKDALAQYNTALTANLDALKGQLGMVGSNAIAEAYHNSLGRDPEAAGMAYWQQQLKDGKSVSDVESGIANSREAQINKLYQQVFGRNVDAASAKYWMSSNKTMAQIEADLKYAKSMGAYANGGMHSGGLRLVGERGPEIEATGPSRIWSASQTRAMLQPANSNGDVAAEIKALRQENAELRAAIRDVAKTVAYTGNQQIAEMQQVNRNLADVGGELKRANGSR